MAHFARIAGNVVAEVHVVANEVITDGNGVEQESLGQAFLADLWGGVASDYVQCSYNGSSRGTYPGPGYLWNGSQFVEPPLPESIALAYLQGKADGAAEMAQTLGADVTK